MCQLPMARSESTRKPIKRTYPWQTVFGHEIVTKQKRNVQKPEIGTFSEFSQDFILRTETKNIENYILYFLRMTKNIKMLINVYFYKFY